MSKKKTQEAQDEQETLNDQEAQDEQETQSATTHTAKQLAAMARDVKQAIKGGADSEEYLAPVLSAHKKYLKEVAAGASASAKDVKFVKTHLQHLQSI